MSVLEPIALLLAAGDETIFTIAAIFARVSAVAFLAPGLGERAVPVRVRLAAAVAFTAILTPVLIDRAGEPPSSIAALAIILTAEAFAGIVFGFAVRLFVFVLQIAGAILAQHVSLSQLFGPTMGFEAESPYTAILLMAGVALAVTADLHFYLAVALIETYEVIPLGHFPDAASASQWAVNKSGDALRIALSLAAPFVVLGFIYSVALAAASRAMPQLMAAFVGAPAITIAGMALFAVTASVLLLTWLSFLERGFASLFGLGS